MNIINKKTFVICLMTILILTAIGTAQAASELKITDSNKDILKNGVYNNVAHDTYSVTVHENAAPTPTPPTQLPPEIVRVETFREGDLVFFRLFFTDPDNDAVGFGFRGAKGSGWGEATFPFSSPSYGRVSPGQIEYPFNHGCKTGPAYESDVEAWIYDSAGLKSPSVTVHLSCQLPAPPPTPPTPPTKLPIDKKETIGPYDTGHKYYIHIFSVDDIAKAIVNGKQIAQINYLQDSGWIDITNYLIEGSNTIEFTEENAPTGGWTYGFEIRQDDSKIIWRDQCGDTGTWGCMNDDRTQGLVYRDILTLTIAQPADSFTYPMDSKPTYIIDYNVKNPDLSSRWSPCYAVYLSEAWHTGEDLFAPANTPVKAVADGVVYYVSPAGYSYPGGVVIIDHKLSDGSHIYSMYSHLDIEPTYPGKILVSKGDEVKKDQPIADGLCNTGSCTGNVHLHWEMRFFADGSGIKKAPDYNGTCSDVPGPGYTYPGQPDNFVANGGAGPTYRWTDPSNFVDTHSVEPGSVFNVGDRVKTTVDDLKARECAEINCGIIKGMPLNSAGTVIEKPVKNTLYWVKIRYDDGTTGWSAEAPSYPSSNYYLQPLRCWEDQKVLTWEDAATKALYAGFTKSNDNASTIVAIAAAESTLKPRNCRRNSGDPTDNTPPSWDRGILQINSRWHPEVPGSDTFSGQASFNWGYDIVYNQTRGFSAWGKYNNGDYKQLMGKATKAVDTVCSSGNAPPACNT